MFDEEQARVWFRVKLSSSGWGCCCFDEVGRIVYVESIEMDTQNPFLWGLRLMETRGRLSRTFLFEYLKRMNEYSTHINHCYLVEIRDIVRGCGSSRSRRFLPSPPLFREPFRTRSPWLRKRTLSRLMRSSILVRIVFSCLVRNTTDPRLFRSPEEAA